MKIETNQRNLCVFNYFYQKIAGLVFSVVLIVIFHAAQVDRSLLPTIRKSGSLLPTPRESAILRGQDSFFLLDVASAPDAR